MRHTPVRRAVASIGVALVLLAVAGCGTKPRVELPDDTAPPDVVLVTYLDALVRGDCGTALALSTPAFAERGPWCFMPHVTSFSRPGVGYQGDDEAGFASQIWTAWGDMSMPDGEHTWFYVLRRGPGGPWRVADHGSGP